MALFVPIPKSLLTQIGTDAVAKGQVYNLDLDQYFNFQFNPKMFEYEQKFNWRTAKYKGDFSGGNKDFISTDPITFELELIFVADPGAPSIEYNTPEVISPKGSVQRVDFGELLKVLRRWCSQVEGLNRPSRMKVIMGDNDIDCVIRTYKVSQKEFFEDATVREGVLLIEFEEWIVQ